MTITDDVNLISYLRRVRAEPDLMTFFQETHTFFEFAAVGSPIFTLYLFCVKLETNILL